MCQRAAFLSSWIISNETYGDDQGPREFHVKPVDGNCLSTLLYIKTPKFNYSLLLGKSGPHGLFLWHGLAKPQCSVSILLGHFWGLCLGGEPCEKIWQFFMIQAASILNRLWWKCWASPNSVFFQWMPIHCVCNILMALFTSPPGNLKARTHTHNLTKTANMHCWCKYSVPCTWLSWSGMSFQNIPNSKFGMLCF